MRKFKKWLYDKFLPLWAKETVLSENKRLSSENYKLKIRIYELESYIKGFESANKLRKIIINANEVAK